MQRIKLFYKDDDNWKKIEDFTGIVEWEWKNGIADPLYTDLPKNEINYYRNGMLHRLDGPAIIADNFYRFYAFGHKYSLQEFIDQFVSKLSPKESFDFFANIDLYLKGTEE